jgi:hypothetical protein
MNEDKHNGDIEKTIGDSLSNKLHDKFFKKNKNGRTRAPSTLIKMSADVQRALELRASGITYAKIGQAMNISAYKAYKYVTEGMNALNDILASETKKLRALELHRLDSLIASIWPSAMEGNNAAIETCRKLIETRSKVSGISRIDTNINVSLTIATQLQIRYEQSLASWIADTFPEANIEEVISTAPNAERILEELERDESVV